MSLRRTLSWSTSIHQIRTDARVAGPVFVAAGRFDRSVIMREAVRIARKTGVALGFSWARRMAVALRAVWHLARQAAVSAGKPPLAA